MKSVLIIEPDEGKRNKLHTLLSVAHYNVIVAANGVEGMQHISKHSFNLILSAIEMPELDGFGLLHLLNRDKNFVQIPFIFTSEDVTYREIRKGMNMGADDFLQFPMDDSELLNAIENRLRRHEQVSDALLEGAEFSKQDDMEVIFSFENIREHSNEAHYVEGDFIYRNGDISHYVYYIQKGSLKTFLYNEDGKEYITGIFRKGEFFGYHALFENRKQKEYAGALEDCEIIKIDKQSFHRLILKNNVLAYQFLQMLSKNVTSIEERMLHLAYSSVRRRLARALLKISQENGSDQIQLSRTDLAHLVGTSTETLVRTLSEMKKDNLISANHNEINIIDKLGLQKLERTA